MHKNLVHVHVLRQGWGAQHGSELLPTSKGRWETFAGKNSQKNIYFFLTLASPGLMLIMQTQ